MVAPFKVKSIVYTVHRICHVLSKKAENSVESEILFQIKNLRTLKGKKSLLQV